MHGGIRRDDGTLAKLCRNDLSSVAGAKRVLRSWQRDCTFAWAAGNLLPTTHCMSSQRCRWVCRIVWAFISRTDNPVLTLDVLPRSIRSALCARCGGRAERLEKSAHRRVWGRLPGLFLDEGWVDVRLELPLWDTETERLQVGHGWMAEDMYGVDELV